VNTRDRRALIAGGSILLAAWIMLRLLPAAAARWAAVAEQLGQQERLLVETRSALEELPRMEREMKGLTLAVSRTAPRLLSGATRDDAIRDLAARLTTIAALEHAMVVSSADLPGSSTAGSLRRITTNTVIQTDFRGVARILERLANDTLSTVVERLRITGAEPRAADNVAERLQVELRISAWYLAREHEG
jgi:hypothetical protein